MGADGAIACGNHSLRLWMVEGQKVNTYRVVLTFYKRRSKVKGQFKNSGGP
jgi:hypothetical protein